MNHSTSPTTRFDIAALKRDHSLVELLAARGIPLRRSGEGRFVARCPFHDDHRPSLLVDPRDEHFHCFACGAHGDVLDFLMRSDGINFLTACQQLVAMPRQSPGYLPKLQPAGSERRWDHLGLDEQVVLNSAAALYQHALWHNPRALAYLHRRGIPDWVIRGCALGFADGHSFEAYLRRRSGLKMAQELGLLRQPRRGDPTRSLREFFAGRLVVPELRGGNCIWMIGRLIDDDGNRPKYLALAGERPVLGFERAAGQREVFLCEGVFDYLTAVTWKLPACSPCGTNLPAERMGFLARAKVIYGVLDGDDAGRNAATTWGTTFGIRWRALSLPEGCDLNDLGQCPGGHAEFFRLLGAARVARRRSALNENRTEGGPRANRD